MNGDGEGGEIEVLDVDPLPERIEALEYRVGPPKTKHNSRERAKISAR